MNINLFEDLLFQLLTLFVFIIKLNIKNFYLLRENLLLMLIY